MTRKTLTKFIAAAFALAGMNAAMACSTVAWTNTGVGGGETGNPIEGDPNDVAPGPVKRYSGLCGLKSVAAASFVTDVSPGAEPKYRARFYAYTGTTAGEALVFRAIRASDSAAMIRVSFDAATDAFKVSSSAGTATVTGAAKNKWYAVELNFSNATPAELRYTIQGAGSSTPLALANGTQTLATAATDVIDTAQLGRVADVTVATGEVGTDAFESRRSTAIGRLCRGNANTDTARNSGDLIAIRNDFLSLQQTLAAGQPDCNEDGSVNSGDLICVRNIFLALQGDCAANPNI